MFNYSMLSVAGEDAVEVYNTFFLVEAEQNKIEPLIEKCKRRARDILYWPGMNNQIAQMVARCEVCLTFRKSQQKEPMKGHQIPDGPWKKVGIDLFQLDKENYVVISRKLPKTDSPDNERTVQTIKRDPKRDPNLALLDLRNTPIDGIGKSPVQLLMGRRTRTLPPTSPKLLQPLYNTDKIKSELYQGKKCRKSIMISMRSR